MEMMIAVMTPAGFSLISSKHFDAHRRAPQLVWGQKEQLIQG